MVLLNIKFVRMIGFTLVAAGSLLFQAGLTPPLLANEYREPNPVVIDGQFTSENEWLESDRLDSLFDLGWIYLKIIEDWEVDHMIYNDTITVAIMHYFNDENYNTMHSYDLNWFQINFPNGRTVTTWVFLHGQCQAGYLYDHQWVLSCELETSSKYRGEPDYRFDDDGGFLVREGEETENDILFNLDKYPRIKPGHPEWVFDDFYGVYAQGGFNESAKVMKYDHNAPSPYARQLYEWSITFPRDWGMPTLKTPGLQMQLNNSGYEWLSKESDPPPIRVKDWKTELGENWGNPGDPGWADSMSLATFFEGAVIIRGTATEVTGEAEETSYIPR